MRPSQGFWGFREKGHLFSGIWGDFGVLGSREQGAEEKHFRELGRKVIFLSGSNPPPPGGGGLSYVRGSNQFLQVHSSVVAV